MKTSENCEKYMEIYVTRWVFRQPDFETNREQIPRDNRFEAEAFLTSEIHKL